MADPVGDAAGKGVDTLSKKVGPLPLGVWVIALGGTIVVVYAVNSKKGSSTGNTLAVANDGTTGTQSKVGDGSVGGWVSNPAATVSTKKTYATNEEWGRAAIQFLIGQGYDAALADIAIRRYLGGLDITVQQRPLITAAINGLGPTPQQMGPISELPGDSPIPGGGGTTGNHPPPTPPTNTGGLFGFLFGLVDAFLPGLNLKSQNLQVPVNGQNYGVDLSYGSEGAGVDVTGPGGDVTRVGVPRPSAATVTPTPQDTTRTYTVVAGDTIAGIALKEYGSSLQANKIYNGNLEKIQDKDNLIPGTVLVIPE